MSSIREQETGHGMGDDRDYFEDDFVNRLPGSYIELPEGYEVAAADMVDPRFTAFLTRDLDAPTEVPKEYVVAELPVDTDPRVAGFLERVGHLIGSGRPVLWSIRSDESDMGKAKIRDIRVEGIQGEYNYVAYLSRQQLDDAETKKTISDLRENGAVTIIDGKTGLAMAADAYHTAALSLLGAAALPYEDPGEASPATDWAHAAVRGVIDELRDRGGIGHALEEVDPVIRQEIVQTLSDVVRAAFIRRAA